jgi:hypothetical protein
MHIPIYRHVHLVHSPPIASALSRAEMEREMAVDPLTQKAAEVIGQLQALAPKATGLAIEAVRYGAMADLICGVIAAVVLTALAVFVWTRFIPWAKRNMGGYGASEVAAVFGSIGLAALSIGLVLMVAATVLNPWTYIALYHPDIYAAHKIIEAATN